MGKLRGVSGALVTLSVGGVLCLSLLGLFMSADGASSGAVSTTSASVRTLSCSESTGTGDGSVSPLYLVLGDVAFLGLLPGGSQALERLPNRLFWDKTYIDVPMTTHQKVVVSIRPLTRGTIGLNWGTQNLNSVTIRVRDASERSLHVESLSIDLCGGSGGFAGGFVMTQPLCAQLSLTEGRKEISHQVEFGAAECKA